ncbi:serpin-ZX, partial [Trifolium medium]|nr:serpin-ZX [Trifolium medium]
MDFHSESITNLTKVSMTMANHLFSKQEFQENNIVFSPLSLYTVLSIITAGSEGPTQQQLMSFLQSESIDQLKSLSSQLVSYTLTDATPTGGPLLSFVNGMWVEQSLSLQPSFKEIVATDFKATLASVDFMTKALEVRKEVNLWAEKETNGLIKNLLPPGSVNTLTKLIFANALYFKGAWEEEFETLYTKDYDFHLLNDNSVKVPFMRSWKEQFIGVFDGFKVLRLPYKHGEDSRQFSIYIFLPDVKDGLLALIEKVASESEFLEHKCPQKRVKVGDFRIPRFDISFELETSDLLKELGVVLPFSPGGLTKMADSPMGQNLYVS